MTANQSAPDELQWRKSSRSACDGGCVEIASLAAEVYVRDSKDPRGAHLRFSEDRWLTFLEGVRSGEFDGR